MKATVKEYMPGRFNIQIRGILPNGEPIRERYTREYYDMKAAKIWAQRRIALLLTGEAKPNESETPILDKFFERFISDHCEANQHKPSGIATKKWLYGAHLSVLKTKQLNDIDEAAIARLKGELAEKGLKPKTVNNILSLVSSILAMAAEWGIIEKAPRIRLVKVAKRAMPFLPLEHYDRLIDGARKVGPKALALVLLGGDAGLRRGEIIALEWGDVDLDRRVLICRRSEVLKKVGETKGLAERMVPITAELLRALTAIKANSGRVISGRGKGSRVDHKTLRSWIEAAEKAAELPITGKLHILRHTYASHLVSAGQSLYHLQMAMGHKDGATTQGYAHVDPESLRTLSDAIDNRRLAGRQRSAALLDGKREEESNS
jgi:integrase